MDERPEDLRERMDERFDDVDRRFGEVDERFDDVDRRFGEVDERFDDVDRRFGEVDQRFDRVEAGMKEGFARVDLDVRELRGDVKGMQRLMIHGFIGTITLMLTGFGILAGMTAS